MIFTARFGALAARPVFPSITVSEHEDSLAPEDALELQTDHLEYDHRSEQAAA